jgi:TPR repeat protein
MMHDESPRGVKTNYDRSKNHFVVTRWLKAAAAQGHAAAQFELGQRYLEGWGVEPSFKEAETNLRAAEEGEFEEAEYIGDWLDSVKETAKATGDQALPHAIWLYESNKTEAALGEFVALAEHGDDPVERMVAAYFAGRINFWGYQEAPPNHEFPKEALKWYRRAAEGGYVWAQIGLGEFYSGWGACDREEARFWYEAAGNQHWDARATLAAMEDGSDWTLWSCRETAAP